MFHIWNVLHHFGKTHDILFEPWFWIFYCISCNDRPRAPLSSKLHDVEISQVKDSFDEAFLANDDVGNNKQVYKLEYSRYLPLPPITLMYSGMSSGFFLFTRGAVCEGMFIFWVGVISSCCETTARTGSLGVSMSIEELTGSPKNIHVVWGKSEFQECKCKQHVC